MFTILPSLIARLKALVLTFIVADLEADLIAAAAERKAELLRQADQYEQHDLPSVAVQIRKQAATAVPDLFAAGVAQAEVFLPRRRHRDRRLRHQRQGRSSPRRGIRHRAPARLPRDRVDGRYRRR
jgi:hypothetical protein